MILKIRNTLFLSLFFFSACGGSNLVNTETSKNLSLNSSAASNVPHLPLGTISNVTSNVACGGTGALSSAVCTSMVVSCHGIADLTAIVAVTKPSRVSLGTIISFLGSGGTNFYYTNQQSFVTNGYTTAQVRWTTPWLNTSVGLLAAGCRPATVMQWVYNNVQGATKAAAFCGIGHSGGSGAVSYALSHYGMDTVLDYASLGAGPPFARIDYGCDASLYNGPPLNLCPQLTNAPYNLPSQMNTPENTTTCGTANPLASDIAKWTADSVVSPGANYYYPQTVVDFFDCTNLPNGTTGGAYFYSSQITSSHSVNCFTSADGCVNESLGSGGNAVVLKNMITSCIPRHL